MIGWCKKARNMFLTACGPKKDAPAAILLNLPLAMVGGLPENLSYN
jgi:hypothetical protein